MDSPVQPGVVLKTRLIGIAALGASLSLCASAARGAETPEGSKRPNIIIIVLDTVRADRVGPREDGSTLTPFLDAWGRQAVVYRRALSPTDHTVPSHFSMLTGLPFLEWRGKRDLPERSVVADLNAAGYDTIGISGNPLLAPATLNCLRPFQTFSQAPSEHAGGPGADVLARLSRYNVDLCERCDGPYFSSIKLMDTALHVNAELKGILDRCPAVAKRPVFLFLNFFDAHDPYLPSEDSGPTLEELWRQWPVNGDLRGYPKRGRAPDLLEVNDWKYAANYTPHGLDFLRRLYDGQVRDLDRALARTFTILRRAGLLERAVVVVTSDHGEALGERGYLSHALVGYGVGLPENIEVPLLIKGYGLSLRRLPDSDGLPLLTHLADSIRYWAGLAPAPDPNDEHKPVPFARILRPNHTSKPVGLVVQADAAKERTDPLAKGSDDAVRKRDAELARRLRSLGYLK